mgnify:CR=1 FL=1
MLYYARQFIDNEDIDSVVKVLRSNTITQGPKLDEFEKLVSLNVNADFALAVNSATSALHLSCLALGVSKGDYVWTSSISFVASANCALYCGANIDFVDIEPNTGLISINKLEQKLKIAHKEGKLPKVIIPVHLAGTSCDMKSIFSLSKKYGFKIIEDASHAIGGKYCGKSVGSCEYSEITVFSFHPVKIITTGEGGMALTNNKKTYEKIKALRGHGIFSDGFELESPGPWYYEQQFLGYNYRFTEIQAALGISQLKKLEMFVSKRNEIAHYYRQKLLNSEFYSLLKVPFDVYSSYHLAIIKIKNSNKILHRNLFEWMRKNKVWVQLHYWPVHLQPYYRKIGFKQGYLPNSEEYAQSCFSIPLHFKTSIEEQDLVLDLLDKGIKELANNS